MSAELGSLPQIRGEYRFNAPLAKNTWLGVGGNAKLLFRPHDVEDLSHFLKNKPKDLNIFTLGVCSNIIIRDGGFDGCIIRLGRNFAGIRSEGDKITAGAGALDSNVARFAAENSIGGLEFLVGVPGTIGGALAMNAGAYGTEIKDIIISAKAIDEQGNTIELTNSDFRFSYRKNSLPSSYIFTEATFAGTQGKKEEILAKMKQISDSREATQPVRTKTGGSTFKNPVGDKKAWQLIDECGLRGYRIGGAVVSEKHCNFLINRENATAADLESLIEHIIATVKAKAGIELQPEIKIIGTR